MDFTEDDLRMDSVSISCWFNTGYMSTSVHRGFFWFRLQKTVDFPQLQSIKVVDFFFVVHDHGDSPVARGHGGRFPCCRSWTSSLS